VAAGNELGEMIGGLFDDENKKTLSEEDKHAKLLSDIRQGITDGNNTREKMAKDSKQKVNPLEEQLLKHGRTEEIRTTPRGAGGMSSR